jgi:hypothetical protein
MLLELTLNKMDLEAGIPMPEDRGPDRHVGDARWANVSKSEPTLHERMGFSLGSTIRIFI